MDDILVLLEDNQVSLQVMSTSRYVSGEFDRKYIGNKFTRHKRRSKYMGETFIDGE